MSVVSPYNHINAEIIHSEAVDLSVKHVCCPSIQITNFLLGVRSFGQQIGPKNFAKKGKFFLFLHLLFYDSSSTLRCRIRERVNVT